MFLITHTIHSQFDLQNTRVYSPSRYIQVYYDVNRVHRESMDSGEAIPALITTEEGEEHLKVEWLPGILMATTVEETGNAVREIHEIVSSLKDNILQPLEPNTEVFAGKKSVP